MKVKFDGRVYDTETATLLASYTNGLPITDDYYVDAFLDEKKLQHFLENFIPQPVKNWLRDVLLCL